MLDHVADVMREQLARYPTPYEENLLALPGVKPFTIERSALIVVLGEQASQCAPSINYSRQGVSGPPIQPSTARTARPNMPRSTRI